MENLVKGFLKRLKEIAPKVTQKEFADLLGASTKTIQRWGEYRGENIQVPNLIEIKKLADKYRPGFASYLAFGDTPASADEIRVLEVIRGFDNPDVEAVIRLLQAIPFKKKQPPKDKPVAKPTTAQQFKLKPMRETMMTPLSTRADLKRYPLSFEPRKSYLPTKLFRDLAAGYGGGENYEVMETAYVKGVPREGYTVAQVRGDSMIKTLLDKDFVVLRDFPAPGFELPSIQDAEEKTPLDVWESATDIRHGDIVVVDFGMPEGKTLKRVFYDTRRGKDRWKMKIIADNPNEWIEGGWQVAVGDHVKFYGTLIGLCEKA